MNKTDRKKIWMSCIAALLGFAAALSADQFTKYLAEKYLKEDYRFRYERSHFALKLILKASEVDDSRPTVIRVSSEAPMFVSVLSGKLNTIYDLAEVL